jgi:hypothetical protein
MALSDAHERRVQEIRHRYNHHKPKSERMKAIWGYCEAGDSWRERYRRFKAAQFWAKGARDNEKKYSDPWQKWNHRFHAYKKRKRAIWKRHQKPEPPPAPAPSQTGCGSCGSPSWGGAQSILMSEVKPISDRHGVPISSNKRSWSAGSDHCTCTACASALDLATFSGAGLAAAIGNYFNAPFTPVGTYAGYYIVRCGRQFRCQTLWAVSGHYDHVHHGMRLIGATGNLMLALRAQEGDWTLAENDQGMDEYDILWFEEQDCESVPHVE